MEVEQNNNALAKVPSSDVSLSLLTLRMIMQGKVSKILISLIIKLYAGHDECLAWLLNS